VKFSEKKYVETKNAALDAAKMRISKNLDEISTGPAHDPWPTIKNFTPTDQTGLKLDLKSTGHILVIN
jgi:hypothetical protein